MGRTCWLPAALAPALGLLLLADPAHARPHGYRAKPCPEALQRAGREVSCGTLTVVEDRSAARGRKLELAVAVLKARARS